MDYHALHTVLEIARQGSHSLPGAGSVRASQVVLWSGRMVRAGQTIAGTTLIAFCAILLVEMAPQLQVANAVAIMGLLTLVVVGLVATWRAPSRAARWFIPFSLVLAGLTAYVFSSLLASKPETPQSLFALVLLPLPVVVVAVLSYFGRKDVALTDWAISEEHKFRQIPPEFIRYDCASYFASSLAREGYWDADAKLWLIESKDRIQLNSDEGFLQVGRPGVDGIGFGYRRDVAGFWAIYRAPSVAFKWLAPTVHEFLEEWYSGRLTV